MATYKSTNPIYGESAMSSAAWQKYFHDENKIGYKAAADLWKQMLAEGTFVVADGKARSPRKMKAGSVPKKVAKVVKKAEKETYKPVQYMVSDPNDPHHYEFVREDFDKESERDERIAEIEKDPLLTYISRGWGDKKFDVCYWRQID